MVARKAHNLEVSGSNPLPATKKTMSSLVLIGIGILVGLAIAIGIFVYLFKDFTIYK